MQQVAGVLVSHGRFQPPRLTCQADTREELVHVAHLRDKRLRFVRVRRVGEAERWWNEKYFTEIVGGTFPRFLRYSVILTIYSITEGTLTEICGFVQKRRQIPFAVHETRGSGLAQRVQYLSRCLGDNFAVPERIQHLATVRHCIAHVSGDLLNENHRQRVENAAKALGLRIEHDRLVVPFEVCAPLAQAALDWLNSIVAVVDPKLWLVG